MVWNSPVTLRSFFSSVALVPRKRLWWTDLLNLRGWLSWRTNVYVVLQLVKTHSLRCLQSLLDVRGRTDYSRQYSRLRSVTTCVVARVDVLLAATAVNNIYSHKQVKCEFILFWVVLNFASRVRPCDATGNS